MPSRSYAYTGGWETFDVPDGVEYVIVELMGGGSGTNQAGRVTGRLATKKGDKLYISVGAAGKPRDGSTGGAAAFGGGGRGGDGASGENGGAGGGGASYIRMNSTTGSLKAVAGGAGGSSGDTGRGGHGGAGTGENGYPGTGGSGGVGNATGGTQTQSGFGGTSSAGEEYGGNDAETGALGKGGRGGRSTTPGTIGGGGGGGGYRAGGGGQAGLRGVAPGGGGGAGSNYAGGLTQALSERGTGGGGAGEVTITWTAAPPANQPPTAPTEVKIDGKDEADGLATKSTGRVKISAIVKDPREDKRVRLFARVSTNSRFSTSFARQSTLVESGKRAEVVLTDLAQNTRYYVRLWAEDANGLRSLNYNAANFWTNRSPTDPELTSPPDNFTLDSLDPVTFVWNHRDPDQADNQTSYELRWRVAPTLADAAGPWQTRGQKTSFESHTLDPGTLRSNTFYQWSVRTQDGQGLWSKWAPVRTLYISGTTTPPRLLTPEDGDAVEVGVETLFTWRFRDPDPGDEQAKADLRYRVRDTPDWITVIGDGNNPGAEQSYSLAPDVLEPDLAYEWQVRTYDDISGEPSDWSESFTFWTIRTPGVEEPFEPLAVVAESRLGCGHTRVFVYDQGGQVQRGEITSITRLTYDRKRDDISQLLLTTTGFEPDCGELLADLKTWRYELVAFRDGVRVWEGPITRIVWDGDAVTVEAKDVMAYVYRRILRNGYNDSYRVVNGKEYGLTPVTTRAARIVINALAPHDPNVLRYLTVFEFPDDAPQSRVVPAYSKTAWEEIDSLASDAGLDYATVGRRIMLWDTHRPIGRLPEMRDLHFNNAPVVTEYGMSGATYFGVTNNNGVWGAAERDNSFTGPVEQLASAYGETAATSTEALSPAALQRLRETLKEQAERNISGRWPMPVVVRVPDNSEMSPDAPVEFNQLIPGVWIPLRSASPLRSIAQWQKLDVVTVNQTAAGEKVSVVMSPAPNGGQDPDAENELEQGGS